MFISDFTVIDTNKPYLNTFSCYIGLRKSEFLFFLKFALDRLFQVPVEFSIKTSFSDQYKFSYILEHCMVAKTYRLVK
jgi:hypothetical protein